ncbi:hypothetical protein [Alkanindiges illinoisensis]|uniref:hypothetical protein n=1 Tax=Alkanindiges illinoisensis TaxID=197183 RepID=UPI00054D2A86|nr:hypothetical protein [Alkanindiges illinoisensis]
MKDVTPQTQPLVKRLKDAAFVGAVGASTALVAANSFAAAELDFSGATGELDGTKTAVKGVIIVLVGLLGMYLAWSWFKKGAK